MQAGRIDGSRLIPEGPAPPRPPERLRPTGHAAIETQRADARLTLTQMTAVEGSGKLITADEIAARIRDHVRQVFEKAGIVYEDISSEEAASRIAPGGYWSAESTAKRIIDFVAGFANGEPDRAQLLRDAVESGFAEAEAAFGGKLPEISYETIELIREGLDRLFTPKVDATA